MAEGVCLVNVCVVVDEIIIAGVVRRIDVDEVDLATMRFRQEFQRGKVVAFNEEVEGSVVLYVF